MAKPIKETPILKGKDAKKFLKRIDENKNKRVSSEEMARLQKSYDYINSMKKNTISVHKGLIGYYIKINGIKSGKDNLSMNEAMHDAKCLSKHMNGDFNGKIEDNIVNVISNPSLNIKK